MYKSCGCRSKRSCWYNRQKYYYIFREMPHYKTLLRIISNLSHPRFLSSVYLSQGTLKLSHCWTVTHFEFWPAEPRLHKFEPVGFRPNWGLFRLGLRPHPPIHLAQAILATPTILRYFSCISNSHKVNPNQLARSFLQLQSISFDMGVWGGGQSWVRGWGLANLTEHEILLSYMKGG
jgi:hypothetical protein